MKVRTSIIALMLLSISGCRQSSFDLAKITVAHYGADLAGVSRALSTCPPGSHVNGIRSYGDVGIRCSLEGNPAIESILSKAMVDWVVIGKKGGATLFVIRDRRNFRYGPMGGLYYTEKAWSKYKIEMAGDMPVGACPCNWSYHDF